MGQDSVVVYMTLPTRSIDFAARAAARIAFTSACAVGSVSRQTVLWARERISPPRTTMAPNGDCPPAIPSFVFSTAIRMYASSFIGRALAGILRAGCPRRGPAKPPSRESRRSERSRRRGPFSPRGCSSPSGCPSSTLLRALRAQRDGRDAAERDPNAFDRAVRTVRGRRREDHPARSCPQMAPADHDPAAWTTPPTGRRHPPPR